MCRLSPGFRLQVNHLWGVGTSLSPNRHRINLGFEAYFWSIVQDDHWSKKIYRPQMIVDVRCYIHLRWSCLSSRLYWKKINWTLFLSDSQIGIKFWGGERLEAMLQCWWEIPPKATEFFYTSEIPNSSLVQQCKGWWESHKEVVGQFALTSNRRFPIRRITHTCTGFRCTLNLNGPVGCGIKTLKLILVRSYRYFVQKLVLTDFLG